MKIGIVGGGTGGPAAALHFARAGHAVTLFERVVHPEPIGAGILLQPTGMAVLGRLGLQQRILAHGSRIERLYGRNAGGRVVLDLAYSDLEPNLFGVGIHRGALFSALWDDCADEPNLSVVTGKEVASLAETPESATLTFADGSFASFDMVVVASGARSPLRAPGATVKPYSWGALWTVAKSDVSAGILSQRYRDTREMVGLLPSGDGTVSVFWSLRTDQLPAWREAGLHVWKEQVLRLMPEVPLDHVVEAEQVLFAPYFDVTSPSWNTARCVWIGDAAHAMSPQLGQGANLALIDASVLAAVVSEGAPLSEYTRRRRAHLRFYSWASYFLTPIFQSSFPILAPPRDLLTGPLHHWGWYRRRMLEALCGAKTGPFGEDISFRT